MPLSTTSELRPSGAPNRGAALLWDAVLSLMLLFGAVTALGTIWGSLKPSYLLPGAAALAAWILCAAGAASKRPWLRWTLGLVPWLALLGLWGREALRGLLLWLNCVLSVWNQLHRDGVSLFTVSATEQSVLAVSVLASFALGQLVWWITARRRLAVCSVLGLVLLLLQLVTGQMDPWIWGLWLTAFLGLLMTGAGQTPARQALRMWGIAALALCLCAAFGSHSDLKSMIQLRKDVTEEVHALRYGKETLPQGHLDQAAKLNEGQEDLLQVQTEQEKNLYLRGFVGAEYSDGVWAPLSGAAYGGDNAGMLDWLEEQGFDPLTQPAEYQALCGEDPALPPNNLKIQVTGGSRCYLYLPSTVESVSSVGTKEKKDTRIAPRGLFGGSFYDAVEYSSSRPAELTVRADWVADPQTEEQSRYAQAEAVYREFVYQKYTQVDAGLEPLLQAAFWEDYEPDSDSIYSALNQIREVLRQRTTYTRTPESLPEGTEPIRDFLTGSCRGNAMLYASTAVEALRSHGIPARYVEGYYLSAAAVSASGTGEVTLTGQDAHAWTEVYFDGIGWLPVDVTPGYYYDAVTLREMVAMPDTVRKTAVLEDSSNGGEQISPVPEPVSRPLPEPVEVIRDAALLLLGLAALIAAVVTAAFLLLELLRLAAEFTARRHYLTLSAKERAGLLQTWIYGVLALEGVDACLGWDAEGTDAALTARRPDVEAGEYQRAAVLMEKFTYGGETPEPFELRTLQAFMNRLGHPGRRGLQGRVWEYRLSWLLLRSLKKKGQTAQPA